MTVVDNNILSALAKIERLELLPDIFETDGRSKRPVIPYDRVHLDIEIAGDTETDHALA